MKVLVTGANGFIGSAAARALALGGHHVVHGARAWPQGASGGAERVSYGDIVGSPDWPAVLAGCEAVVHCAGEARVDAYNNSQDAEAVTVGATERLARACIAAGVRRLVLISTVYAADGEAHAGDCAAQGVMTAPQPYGRVKRAAEVALEQVAAGRRLEWVILRPPLVYGPGCTNSFRRLESLVRRRVPLPFGSALAPRSFVAISNLASAIAAVVTSQPAAGHRFFVCDDERVSTAELIRRMGRLLGLSVPLVPVPEIVMRGLGRVAGMEREMASLFDPLLVDSSELKACVGWTPLLSLDQGLRAAMAMPNEPQMGGRNGK